MPRGKRGELLDELGLMHDDRGTRQRFSLSDFVNDKLGGMPPESKVVLPIATQFGIVSLDLCLGGGVPSGITEIYGEESVGKTGLIGHLIARSQQLGLWVMLCSGEFLDIPYFIRLGVDVGNLVVASGDLESIRDLVGRFLSRSPGRIAIVDSLSALQPTREDPGAWNEAVYEFLQMKVANQSALVVVNQVRAKRSVDPDKKLTSGTESSARWVHDLYDARIELSRRDVHEESYTMVANVVANSQARPAVWVELPAVKGAGVDVRLDRLRAAVRAGIIRQKGPRFYLGFKHIGLGEEEAALQLEADDEVHGMVMDRLRRAAR